MAHSRHELSSGRSTVLAMAVSSLAVVLNAFRLAAKR